MEENKDKTMKPEEQTTETENVKEPKAAKKEKKATPKKEDKTAQIEALGEKLAEINDKYLRLTAEFDNYRKRTLKERIEMSKTAGEKLLCNLLPVVDNFERALRSMEKTSDVAALKTGVDVIYADFNEYLKRQGVKPIPTENVAFDADLHEAIATIPATSEEQKGKIVDCVEKGYYLEDKVIRFAKVVVAQ